MRARTATYRQVQDLSRMIRDGLPTKTLMAKYLISPLADPRIVITCEVFRETPGLQADGFGSSSRIFGVGEPVMLER